MIKQTYSDLERALNHERPNRGNDEGTVARPWRDLLPEPLAEMTDKVLARILNISIIYYSLLAGAIVLTIGLGVLIVDFAAITRGIILTVCGSILILGPATFLKLVNKK